jgi:gas vesicle structural protein
MSFPDDPFGPDRPLLPEHPLLPDEGMTLAELVNKVLDKGAIISGDVVISVAGVDLIYLGMKLLLTSMETVRKRGRFF